MAKINIGNRLSNTLNILKRKKEEERRLLENMKELKARRLRDINNIINGSLKAILESSNLGNYLKDLVSKYTDGEVDNYDFSNKLDELSVEIAKIISNIKKSNKKNENKVKDENNDVKESFEEEEKLDEEVENDEDNVDNGSDSEVDSSNDEDSNDGNLDSEFLTDFEVAK